MVPHPTRRPPVPRPPNQPAISLLLPLLLLYIHGALSAASDTLGPNDTITDDGRTLTSAGGTFKLGFFTPGSNDTNRYVGIWYNSASSHSKPVTIWVANRDSPVHGTSGVLMLSATGLLLLNRATNTTLWSTNISAASKNTITIARLLDSGALVLLQSNSNDSIWSSFDHLTDTLLPTAKLTFDFKTNTSQTIQSWRSATDPSSGSFRLVIKSDVLDQALIQINGSTPYWRTGPWIGQSFIGVPDMDTGYLTGSILNRDGNKITFMYTQYSGPGYITRLSLDPGGQLIQWLWNSSSGSWLLNWRKPEDQCDVYNACGEFALCNPSSLPACSCMRGFVPMTGNQSGGCMRRTELECERNQSTGNTTAAMDGFVRIGKAKVPDNAWWIGTNNETECKEWCSRTCQCLAYAFVLSNCLMWGRELLDVKVFLEGGHDLYIKLHPSELDQAVDSSGKNKKRSIAIASILAVLAIVLLSCLIFFVRRRRRNERREQSKTTQALILAEQEIAVAFEDSSSDARALDFLQYDIEKIVSATESFSLKNKLGEGGFGQVYKGVLPGGQEIAVKRLSMQSRQGLKEFRNEVLLISKLQHRNLVQLLGYCIDAEEKLLVYEFMPNKSLDAFLFGGLKDNLMDWSKRFNIILGISQGLLYLHRDSRLRIIHRDLKASNILLDADWNPKISDFGTARIFGIEQVLETNTIIGTHGYMSPEYALQGHFSERSDVYSFGVLMLEIMSGTRVSRLHGEQGSLNLLGYAWKLWKEGNALELIDANLRSSWPQLNAMKCINVALLCVQELAAERPTMSSVVSMLSNDSPLLPIPKEPLFVGRQEPFYGNLSEGKKGLSSVYNLTITQPEGR